MKRILLIATLILLSKSNYSQQFEIGPNLAYGFVNIADNNSNKSRAVIGDPLWNLNYGFNAVFYFNKPSAEFTARLGLLYRKNKRGSVSELNKNNKFEISSNSIGLFGGVARDVSNGTIFYINLGLGYNSLDDSSVYKGTLSQTEAFNSLEENLTINPYELALIYSIGFEREITKHNLKVFAELSGDGGFPKLNKSKGSLITQSLGFGTGIRYVFDLKPKEE